MSASRKNKQDLNNAAGKMKQAVEICILIGILLALMIIMPAKKKFNFLHKILLRITGKDEACS